jgi:hypothetical protein
MTHSPVQQKAPNGASENLTSKEPQLDQQLVTWPLLLSVSYSVTEGVGQGAPALSLYEWKMKEKYLHGLSIDVCPHGPRCEDGIGHSNGAGFG